MKKIIFLLPFLMLASLFSMGQNIKHVSLNFSMDYFKTQRDDAGNTYVLSDNLNYFLKSDTLLPALPYIGYNVLIGSTDKYDSHTISGSKSLFRNNVIMAQNPEAIPTNMKPDTKSILSTASYSQRTYPNEFVEFAGMNECDGYRILTFHVCPFEYDATAKKLYLRTHIDLDINLSYFPSASQTRTGNIEAVRNTIRQMVINPEDMDEQQLATGNRSSNILTKQTGYEYVIVTSNQFKSTFQQLADWKSSKGIRSKVLTTDEVSSYAGSTLKEKIKNALAEISNLSYVLLGGDTLNVPTCMCYLGHQEAADSITPADVYYSCLGTMNWDSNGNGLNGDVYDTFSMIPTLNVSRAPVSTITDAQAFVNRIINYESAPDTTNWEDNILMSGRTMGDEDLYGNWVPVYDSEGHSDSQIWSQMMYYQCIDPLWEGENCTFFYDTYTNISGQNANTYNFTEANLQTELEKGYTFVDVMTHGYKSCWVTESGNNYQDYARWLNNSGYTVITTTACLTNAFDFHTTMGRCLSQRFINNPQSGILAYLGTSRENWYTPNAIFDLGNDALFDTLAYNKIFHDNYHRIGKAVTEVKKQKMAEIVGLSYSAARLTWLGLNLMGDPEMPIFVHKPKSFQDVSIQFVNDSIYVDTGTGGFDICFINKNDSTDYYIARDIADSVVEYKRINAICDTSITKPGYIPYTTTCTDTYFQNITWNRDLKTYKTGYAVIGSDVTDKVAQGSVVVNDETDITIQATQGATIAKDFEVKLGGILSITNQ